MKLNKIIILLSTILMSSDINYPDHKISDSWITLNDDNIWVGYLETETIDWCRTSSILPYNINDISLMIEDLSNYNNIFDRVILSDVVGKDIVHIRVDMPFPISDRDYIVKYTTEKSDYEISYKFKAADNISIDIDGNCIRLINAAGEWHLKESNSSNTVVTYTWNGELRGDFPSWALTRAWETQGLEMINWLRESLNEQNKD